MTLTATNLFSSKLVLHSPQSYSGVMWKGGLCPGLSSCPFPFLYAVAKLVEWELIQSYLLRLFAFKLKIPNSEICSYFVKSCCNLYIICYDSMIFLLDISDWFGEGGVFSFPFFLKRDGLGIGVSLTGKWMGWRICLQSIYTIWIG